MIIAIDIETYEFNKKTNTYEPILDARKFTLGCAKTDTGKIYFFYEAHKMYQWLTETIQKNKDKGKRTFIYGHNTEYDWYGLAQGNLLDKRTKYINFSPFIAIHNDKGYILDTMAFYRMSLATVGQILKFPKGTLPRGIKSIEELKPYLLRDVEITLQAILELKNKIKTLGFTPRKLLTAGQLAMSSFLTFCKREKIEAALMKYNPETKHKEVIKTKYPDSIREAYRGGNNTAYQIGKFENVTLLDINALYAYCMANMNFPNLATEQKLRDTPVGMLKAYLKEHIGIARCKITAPNITYGYLPIRYAGYQLFPTNTKLRGTWTYLELERAIELGYEITECEWTIKWKKQTLNPLKRFIEHLHELEKKCKTKEEKSPLKLLRNNLYGKFAQNKNNKDYKIVYRDEVEKYIQNGYQVKASTTNKYILVKEGIKYEPSYTNPLISTLITAYGRDYLYKEISKVPKEDMLYCDTDSIMFKGNHIDKFNIGWNMGQFKIENKGKAKILGEKRYYVEEQARISGLPRRDISKTAIELETEIKTRRMVGLGSGLRIGSMEEIGSFADITIEMKPHCKANIPIPTYIDEVGIVKNEEE